jgi:peptidoglycan/LPS O-acetylase OafA/YrhL
MNKHTETTTKSRLDFLDIARGLAALGVIWVHTNITFPTGIFFFDRMSAIGSYGVQLFYVISAYTMMFTLSNRIHKESYPFIKFYIRRLLRIAVPFWFAIALYQLFRYCNVPYFASENSDFFPLITSMLLLQGLWPTTLSTIVPGGGSIATEVLFYLIFPLVFFIRHSVPKLCFMAIFVVFLDHTVVRSMYISLFDITASTFSQEVDNDFFFFYYYIFNQFPVFITGVLFYLTERKETLWNKQSFLCVLLFALTFALISPKLFVVSCASVVLLFALKKFEVGFYFVKVTGFLKWIGMRSYSMYLFHFTILNILLLFFRETETVKIIGLWSFIIAFIATTLLTCLITPLTKRYLEDIGSSSARKILTFRIFK